MCIYPRGVLGVNQILRVMLDIFPNKVKSYGEVLNQTKYVCVCSFASVMSDALQLCALWPARLLCPWDSPGKNTGVGSLSLL